MYKLGEAANYDSGNKVAACDKAQEWGDRIPIWVIYRKELPTFEEQLPALSKVPLVRQRIEPGQIAGLLDEFL